MIGVVGLKTKSLPLTWAPPVHQATGGQGFQTHYPDTEKYVIIKGNKEQDSFCQEYAEDNFGYEDGGVS